MDQGGRESQMYTDVKYSAEVRTQWTGLACLLPLGLLERASVTRVALDHPWLGLPCARAAWHLLGAASSRVKARYGLRALRRAAQSGGF